ncbi:hypothetical protein BWI17_11750 [Betaproteobacteria bacterium GR16-43]|nr:hypothetical protein BWI17_11750 [Betaproteobacteria bacterium GR16-43]
MRAYSLGTPDAEAPGLHDGSAITSRLDDALATKLVGVLRCRRHYFLARRDGAVHAVDMFLAHSNRELAHADAIAERIVELGAEPNFSPIAIAAHSHVTHVDRAPDIIGMAREGLDAVRGTDVALTEFLEFVGGRDAPTRRLLMSILDDDRSIARQLITLIATLGKP